MAENKPVFISYMKELCTLLNAQYFIFRKYDIHKSALGETQVCTVKLAIACAYGVSDDLNKRKAIWRFRID